MYDRAKSRSIPGRRSVSRPHPAGSTLTAVLAAAALLALGACGTSASPSISPSASSGGGQTATGSPVVAGFFNQEDSPTGSFPEYRLAILAAVKYVNAELNGLAGHPIQIETCTSKGSPETSIACANQILEKHPLLVLGGADFSSPAALDIYRAAKVPIIGGLAASPPEQMDSNSIRWFSSLAVFSGLAAYAGDTLHARSAVILHPDFAPANNAAEHYIKPVLAHKGITNVHEVTASLSTTDWTPAVSSANDLHPDVIIFTGDPSQCIPIIRARKSLGVQARLLMPAACSDPRILGQIGAAADGIIFGFTFLPPSADDPDVHTFVSKLGQYGDGQIPLDDFSSAAFNEVLNLHDIVARAGALPADGPGVIAAFKAARGEHSFMGPSYTCDGTAAPGLVAVCNASIRVTTYQQGKIVDSTGTWVSGSALIG